MSKQTRLFFLIAVIVVVGGALAFFLSGNKQSVYPDITSPRPFLGTEDAPILVEEFSDFQCPACQSAESTAKQVVNQYGDQIRFEYRHFPLSQIHPFAFRAALAAECANDQGKFWEYHDLLFANQPKFSPSELEGYAQQLGLDTESFSACLDERAKDSVVKDDISEGNKRQINSTPTFFVNGQPVANWTQLGQAVAALLPPATSSDTMAP